MLALCAWGAWAADDLTGKWLGELKIEQDLRLVLKVVETDAGVEATLDSLDQGAMGLAVDTVEIKDGKLVFSMSALSASFEGQLNDAQSEAVGEWNQGGQTLPLTLKREGSGEKALIGTWNGALEIRATLRLRFNIDKGDEGYTGTMDSLDQGANGIPFTNVTEDSGNVVVESSAVGGRYEGKLAADGDSIEGTWSQGGQSLPLTLKRE